MFSSLLEGNLIYEEDISNTPPLLKITEDNSTLQAYSSNSPSPSDSHNSMKACAAQFCLEQFSGKRKPKESNPNLLKNLVTIFKTWVKLDSFPKDSLIRAIWEHFKSSTKPNKNLLNLVYGYEKFQCSQIHSFLEKLGPEYQDSSCEDVKNIQKTIREESIRQLQEADVEFVLKNRRVRDKEQFEKYFYSFWEKIKGA